MLNSAFCIVSSVSAISPSPLAFDIARTVSEAGGRAFVVGGWVRDRLRGEDSKDIDIEVFGIAAAELPGLLAALGRVEPAGQSFPVFKVARPGSGEPAIDVALPRRESKRGRGHKAFDVQGDPSMTLAEAARRREFTINAISWDPLRDEYQDPCGGRADLERRLLRAVDLRTFGDDSLRVLRAVQFAARFEFALEDQTAALCRRIPLDDLPAERIWGEVEKLLLQAPRPSIGFALALDLGIIEAVLPEMRPLVGCAQEPEWHPEGDVWVHTLMVIDKARQLNGDLDRPRLTTVMLGAVCHDLGKPATTAVIDGRIRSIDHEQVGVAPTLSLLDRLNVHTIDGFDVRAQVVGLVANHLKPGMFHKAQHVGDGAFRRLAQKVKESILIILGTQHGERVMRPTFGCNLRRLVFAPNDAATASLARYYVEEGLTTWEPRIVLDEVRVENDNDQGRLLVHIDYRIKSTYESRNLVYPFYLQPE